MHTATTGRAQLGEEVGDAHGNDAVSAVQESRAQEACPWGIAGVMAGNSEKRRPD